MTLAEIEKHAILETLKECQWHQGRAAEALDISERTIRHKIKLYRQEGERIPAYCAAKIAEDTKFVNSEELSKYINEARDFASCETSQYPRTELCSSCGEAPSQPNHSYCRDCHAAYMREWRKTHPLTEEQAVRARARSKAGQYHRRGLLQEKPCEVCGEKAEKHHEDYSKPLQVRWLCRKHHEGYHARRPTEKQLQKVQMEQRKRRNPGT